VQEHNRAQRKEAAAAAEGHTADRRPLSKARAASVKAMVRKRSEMLSQSRLPRPASAKTVQLTPKRSVVQVGADSNLKYVIGSVHCVTLS
jgi:hypothetical protein